jgi:hypothetical protein
MTVTLQKIVEQVDTLSQKEREELGRFLTKGMARKQVCPLDQAQLEALAAAPLVESKGVNLGQAGEPPRPGKESLGDFVLRVAGTAEGLPPDLAENHDHYLYGTPRRTQR